MKKKRLLGILFGLALVLAIMPTQGMTVPVYADDHVTWSTDQSIDEDRTIYGGVTFDKDVKLTIAEGKTLSVYDTIRANEGKNIKLTIEGSGTLIVKGSQGSEGIVGSLVVNDGSVDITGGSGIDGNYGEYGGADGGNGNNGVTGSVTVNGGSITISGGRGGNGGDSGSGRGGNGGNGGRGITDKLTVNGGSVNVNGGDDGSGGSGSGSGNSGKPGEAVYGELTCENPLIFAESENGISWTTVSDNNSQKQYIKSAVGYPLWVGGVQVNSANMNDVLGTADGDKETVKFTPAVIEDNVLKKPAALALDGAEISGKKKVLNNNNNNQEYTYNIFSNGIDLEVVLKGTNTIGNPQNFEDCADYAIGVEGPGDLTIKGSGQVTANGKKRAIMIQGGNLSVTDGAEIEATADNAGSEQAIYVMAGNVGGSNVGGNITISSSKVTATGDAGGLIATGANVSGTGNIDITGSEVTAIGGSQGINAISATGDIRITDCSKTLVAEGTETGGSLYTAIKGTNITVENSAISARYTDKGIYAYGGNLTINNSIVNANTNGEAICAVKKDAGGDISISNSTVTAKGSDALCGYEVELNNSTVTAEGETCAIRAYDKIDIVDSKMDGTEGQIYTEKVLTIRDSRVIASNVANTLYGVNGINIEETENGDTYVEATIKKESGKDGNDDYPDIAILSGAYFTITGPLAITEPKGGEVGNYSANSTTFATVLYNGKPASHVIITTPDPSGGGNVPYVDAVQRVVNKIKALPDPDKVTLNDEKAVNEANKAFNDLTDAQKGDSRLTPELKSKLEDCVNVLDKARKAKEDQEAADKVSGMIDALPDDPEKAGKDDAQAAFGAYMALTDAQKELLTDKAKQKVAAYKYFYEVKYAEAQKVKMSSAKAKKGGKAVVKWKKNKAADGYRLYYKAKGVKAKYVNIKSSKTVKTTVKKLKDGKVYSFKVRSYTKVNDPSTGKAKKVYGKWSKAKKVKAKK